MKAKLLAAAIRGAIVGACVWLLLHLLAGCGGGSDEPEACPVVTPENVHRMTGDVPPGSPCAQVLIREPVTLCALPIDQAGPPQPCQG